MSITLKAARVNKQMTQIEAAEKLGIAVDTLRQYESGKTFPDVPMIRKIEDLMRSDPDMTGVIRDITSNITTSSGSA